MKVYLACCRDRHLDDEFAVFQYLDDAKEQIKEWQGEYGGCYEFREPVDWEPNPEWVHYLECSNVEEGPHFWVKELEMKE
jgi:hypothetical protein